MLSVLSLSQFELYPKLCILISRKPTSFGSHSCGQYRDGSPDFVHVLREPPPNPCTNTKSAIAGIWGSKRVFSPNGPFESSGESLLPSRRLRVREKKDRLEVDAVVFERSSGS